MNTFQQQKATELRDQGFTEQSRQHHHTGNDRIATYGYWLASSTDRRCYLAPNYIQFV